MKLIEAAVVFAPRNFPSGTFFGLLLLDSSVKITQKINILNQLNQYDLLAKESDRAAEILF